MKFSVENYNMYQVNQAVGIFIIEGPLHKIALVAAISIICSLAAFILISMMKFNNNRPIQKQNITDNLLLKNACPLLLFEVFASWIVWMLRIFLEFFFQFPSFKALIKLSQDRCLCEMSSSREISMMRLISKLA